MTLRRTSRSQDKGEGRYKIRKEGSNEGMQEGSLFHFLNIFSNWDKNYDLFHLYSRYVLVHFLVYSNFHLVSFHLALLVAKKVAKMTPKMTKCYHLRCWCNVGEMISK